MRLTIEQMFLGVCVFNAIGVFVVGYGLYKAFGNGMVFKIFIRVFPGASLVLILTSWAWLFGIGAVPLYNLMVGTVNVGLILATFIFTGKYFEKNLVQELKKVNREANNVASAAELIAGSGQQLADSSSAQAASIEEISASIEEISASIRQNAENSSQAKDIAGNSRETILKAENRMKAMKDAIAEIDAQATETAKIIKTIDEIAFQTNLLALNAAVEAARAGEAGAGFAVVADEVRNLAKRSAEAAKYTTDLIGSVQKSVKRGVQETEEISDFFKNIQNDSGTTVQLVSSVATASTEQTIGVDQINKAIAQLDTGAQMAASGAEESASTAEELSTKARELKEIIQGIALFVTGKKDVVVDTEKAGAATEPVPVTSADRLLEK